MRILGTARWIAGNLVGIARNQIVSLRRRGLDYVLLPLEGSYPERRERRSPLPFPFNQLPLFPTEPSLEALREACEVLGRDRRVRGVILRVGSLSAGPTAIQAIRAMIADLGQHGKQVVCWLAEAGTWATYLASACDRIIMPESGTLAAVGLRVETSFLKDTLGLVGIEADFESLREYKTAPDTFRRSRMSAPHREMLESILDASFDELVGGIAAGRQVAPDEVRAWIDGMPLSAREAMDAGLIDRILYEDELADDLGSETHPADLLPWHQAQRRLRRPISWRRRPVIGVISVHGTIVTGRSRDLPPLPIPLPLVEQFAGSDTVSQALRAAETDERIAAVILHVESPGGAAVASDLIWREVRRLCLKKPVVAMMGDLAASGGYYVAAAANHIVAQPTTLTGSIGIWAGKFVTAGLYERLRANRETLQRGAHAGLYADTAPFDAGERQTLRQILEVDYEQFKARVAKGRGMEPQQVEERARGRVWTGRQALAQGLIDELGGFETALRRAKILAQLDPERPLPTVTVSPPRAFALPMPFAADSGALPALLEALQRLNRARTWALPPWTVRLRE